MNARISIAIRIIAWLKLELLKLAVWRFSMFWPWRKRLPKLLILRPDNFGDLLITMSSFQELCDYYHGKGYEITILVPTKNLIFAQKCPLFDRVIAYDIYRDDFSRKERMEMYRRLYAERFSVVINPYVLSYTYVLSHFITLMCRPAFSATAINRRIAPYYMSPVERYLWQERWPRFYSLYVVDDSSSIMEAEHHLAERVCGRSFPLKLYSRGFGDLPDVELPERYYIVVPGTISRKPWPMENIARLMVKLHEKRPDLTAVLTGAPNERHWVDEIRESLPENIPFINKIGESTLFELFTIIRDAHFVVTNDTGTAHLAPLLGMPSVVILGGGQIGAYLPNPLYANMQCITHPMECFNCGWNCDKFENGVNRCIYDVTVEDVFAAIEKITEK